ncbi:MAG TPA: hypothetical protein VNO20_04935 [Solirubrobacterales bacterium]|nr:hypothetical protein [Solirubrobacterales bacterium]
MANQNPTGSGHAVALTIPADQVRFLRSLFEMARDGIKDELERYPDKLREPTRLHREEAVYGRLLTALDECVIVPDSDVRAVLRDLAQIIDADNEYERVIAEHQALHGLLGQLSR